MLQLISLKKYKHFYGSRYPLTLFFEQSTESVSIKRFTDTLRNADRLITCNTTNNCLKYVRGGNAVYAAVSCDYIYRRQRIFQHVTPQLFAPTGILCFPQSLKESSQLVSNQRASQRTTKLICIYATIKLIINIYFSLSMR